MRGWWRNHRIERVWVEFSLRCNNGDRVIFIIKLWWFSVFQCEKTDLIYLAWGLQTHKTKLTSMVYQLRTRCCRHFRINKRSLIRLNYIKCQIITQPVHVSKNILEFLYWVATERETGVSVPVAGAQRHCCHRWCLIATVSDKIHKAWPLAS